MLHLLSTLDKDLFYLVNGHLHGSLLDVFFPYLTKVRHWRVPIAVVWFAVFMFGGRRGRIVALLMIPAIAAADIVNDRVLKTFFDRVRPCNAFGDVRLLIGCPGSSSFPSGHATNAFSAATLLASFYGWRIGVPSLLLAGLIGYSRVYVGVHYPFDVLASAVVGSAWATLVYLAWKRFERRKEVTS
ncbi:MAG: hypothetical protein A2Y95_05810 [Deltaproteobacteria bacterium RBG_13_65_10]|jgi:undecaprenyl-diphosphatase|nr:MAG: hypothetical protein A2Y95_05810 [Deltaproteobacteria bacterium RBG_13_65_10]